MNTQTNRGQAGRVPTEESSGADALARALGGVALVGVAFITVTCLLVQFLRTDPNWSTTSMSIYVTGPYGTRVRASFYAPAPGIAALGIGWNRALDRRAQRISTDPVPRWCDRAVRARIVHRRRDTLAGHAARQDPSMGGVRHIPVHHRGRAAAIAALSLRRPLTRAIHRSHHDRIGVRGLFLDLCAVADSARPWRKSRDCSGAGVAVAGGMVVAAGFLSQPRRIMRRDAAI